MFCSILPACPNQPGGDGCGQTRHPRKRTQNAQGETKSPRKEGSAGSQTNSMPRCEIQGSHALPENATCSLLLLFGWQTCEVSKGFLWLCQMSVCFTLTEGVPPAWGTENKLRKTSALATLNATGGCVLLPQAWPALGFRMRSHPN